MQFSEARRIADAAFAAAKERNREVAVVVVDAAGWIVLAERRTQREPFVTYSAECKAVTAALIGRDSKDCAGMVERYPVLTSSLSARLEGRFLPLAGGVLVRREGEGIGAVGVAGGGGDDHDIAAAGAAAARPDCD